MTHAEEILALADTLAARLTLAAQYESRFFSLEFKTVNDLSGLEARYTITESRKAEFTE